MEILDATLKELVAKERNHNNLQEIYVKKLFPSFQQEFKNYDIHDIQNYENYNLQNILDDLRHIQMLLEESPDEKRFLAKKEFLVKLSQKILKKIEKDYPADPPASSKPENNKQEKDSDVIQLPIIRKQKQATVAPKKEQPKLDRKSLTSDIKEPVVAKEPEKIEVKEEKPAEPIVPQVKVDIQKRESVKVPKEVAKVEPKPVKVEERIEPKVEPKIEEKAKPEEPAQKEKVGQPIQVQVEEKEPVKEVMEVEPVREEEDASKRKEPKNIIVKKGEKVQRPSSQDRKKRPISIKRKKSLPGREKLIMIDEEAVDEGSGAEEDDEKEIIQEKPKKKMEFSLEQEKQIQEMSAQYGVEIEALKSYLETKAAHNQFNWMGIKRLERKVDINLEISKLEFEYERFVKRKDRYRSSKLAEIVSSPDSLPYLSKSHTTLHHHQKSLPQNRFFGSYYPPENHKDPKSMTFGGGDMDWGAIDENFAETISNSLPGSPRSLNRMATIQSLTLTRDNSNQEQNLRNQGTLLQSKNVQEDHWSEGSFGAKSKGQVKLPSITSFNPSKKHIPTQTTVNAVSFDLGDDSSAYRRLNSTSEPNIGTPVSLVSPSYKAQLKMKRNSSSGYVHLPGLGEHRMMLNRIDTKISIEDSLSGELTNKHREYREFREPMSAQAGANFEKKLTTETKKGLSQMNTTRSNYLMSLNSLAKPDYADSVVIDGFSTLRSTTGRTDVQLKGRDEYNRYNQDVTQFSRKGTEEARGDGESFAMGATMQTISTKSMTSVYSQEAPSRFMSLRSMGSGMRVVEGDLEYYGTVKRINLLGSGSQAKVFLCEVKEFEQLVALKQYDANKSQYGGQSYEALKDEFHMLRQLDQENVIQYYCLYRSKRKTFSSFVEFGVIMEFMPGGSLEKYIETSFDSITMKTKRSFIKQILKGLDCLHSNKIIHRDLKPANILLSEDQSLIKISDFGISTQTKNDNDMAKSIVGTPWYIAPEIINEETYSYKADIWSAGCCFIHLLTGNKPYHMANARQAMLLMANHNTPLESCDESSIKMIESHKGLKELLELCFSKDKDIRASAATLLESPFFEGV